jgi:CheY-like chemotaxis protein
MALKFWRKIESLNTIPFIFLTGKTDRADYRKGMNLSADDYLTKPFRKIELLQAVNARLSRSKEIFDSINTKLKELEGSMEDFLTKKNKPRIEELENLIEKLKRITNEKQAQIQNYSFINSHLLRGPVANILGCLELAKNDPKNYAEILTDIGKSTIQLDQIINGLNDLLSENQRNEFNLGNIKTGKGPLRTVFLVDDDDIQLKITQQFFKKFYPSLAVSTFNNPLIALTKIKKEEKPDKLFLDIFMPELDGWEFLDELKKFKIELDITVLSSSIDPEDIKKAKEYTCVTSYISKPVTKEKMEKALSDEYLKDSFII